LLLLLLLLLEGLSVAAAAAASLLLVGSTTARVEGRDRPAATAEGWQQRNGAMNCLFQIIYCCAAMAAQTRHLSDEECCVVLTAWAVLQCTQCTP
jgi:hypothetical protein